ncbi:hypothetical protein EON63_13220 [archaeon]|nr:MAG: hypothetical protein EON63_13220 [archaeon]
MIPIFPSTSHLTFIPRFLLLSSPPSHFQFLLPSPRIFKQRMALELRPVQPCAAAAAGRLCMQRRQPLRTAPQTGRGEERGKGRGVYVVYTVFSVFSTFMYVYIYALIMRIPACVYPYPYTYMCTFCVYAYIGSTYPQSSTSYQCDIHNIMP